VLIKQNSHQISIKSNNINNLSFSSIVITKKKQLSIDSFESSLKGLKTFTSHRYPKKKIWFKTSQINQFVVGSSQPKITYLLYIFFVQLTKSTLPIDKTNNNIHIGFLFLIISCLIKYEFGITIFNFKFFVNHKAQNSLENVNVCCLVVQVVTKKKKQTDFDVGLIR
jgi:hypothetical protein